MSSISDVRRWLALVACAGLVMTAMAVSPAGDAGAVEGAPATGIVGPSLWSGRAWDDAFQVQRIVDAVVGPDGKRVFVTGQLYGVGGTSYGTVAYGTGTGAKLWMQTWLGGGCPGYESMESYVQAMTVSADGSTVFVTGQRGGCADFPNTTFATVAYDAATGAELWTNQYGPGESDAWADATDVAATPDGHLVIVSGYTWEWEAPEGPDFTTIALDAATGEQRWVRGAYGPGATSQGTDQRAFVAVAPDGSRVFVTSRLIAGAWATIAYDPDSGARLWATHAGRAVPSAIAVSSDGTRVFATGRGSGSGTGADFSTIAYSAATGARLWIRRYDGPAHETDVARALGVTPDGTKVLVTGVSTASPSGQDFTTIAYRASTGTTLWTRRYDGSVNGIDDAFALGVSPDGTRVYVAGQITTARGPAGAMLAYGTTGGSSLGVARSSVGWQALALGPLGARVFVSGAADYEVGITTAYPLG